MVSVFAGKFVFDEQWCCVLKGSVWDRPMSYGLFCPEICDYGFYSQFLRLRIAYLLV